MSDSEKITLELDVDSLTLGEIEQLEEIANRAIGEIFDIVSGVQPMRASVLTAIVWLVKRRQDPSFTVEQARSTRVSLVLAAGGETDPTEPPPVLNGATATSHP